MYYRVNIDGRIYEGSYGSKANAVFGAICKDQIDRNRNRETWSKESLREEARQPTLIGVEILDHKVAKKVHRVN